MKCSKCGSYAINHRLHGRDGSDPDLCDVCYWRKRAEKENVECPCCGADDNGEEMLYSLDKERFYPFDDIQAIVNSEYEPETRVKVYSGKGVLREHSDYLGGLVGHLIESMNDEACDDVGDIALQYLSDVKEEDLKKVILKWLNENAKQPSFRHVGEVEECFFYSSETKGE